MMIRLSDRLTANAPLATPEIEAMLSQLPVGLIVVDAGSGAVIHRNAAFARLLDGLVPAGESVDCYACDALAPDGNPYLPPQFPIARALAGETVNDAEVIYRNEDRQAHLLMTAMPVRDPQGTVVRALALLTDISAQRHAERLHDTAQHRLALALQGMPMAAWSLDLAGGDGQVDQAWFAQLGYAPSQVRPTVNALLGSVHPQDRVELLRHWQDYLSGRRRAYEATCRMRTAHGNWHWVLVRAQISERSAAGKPQRACGALFDIDRRRRNEIALRDSERRFRNAFHHAPAGMAMISPSGRWLAMNGALRRILGFDPIEPARNQHVAQTVHPDHAAAFDGLFQQLLRGERTAISCEQRWLRKNGEAFWAELALSAVSEHPSGIRHLVAVVSDRTEQRRAQEEARQRAQLDPLTGLPNRRLLHEFAEHMVAAARRSITPLAVLFFDLDHFKAVNDRYGHRAGDDVLKEVAARLNALMRAEDVIGRLGGDEFVAILPKIGSSEDAAIVAGKALESLRRPYHVGGRALHLSPSIGISLFPRDGETIDLLIQHADAAMYQVKHGERDSYRFYTPEWNAVSQASTELERHLRNGLERHEFMLHYQPIIDTRSGKVTGVEALLRWRRADGTQVDPAVFLPVAESSGLIVPIGEWILRRACDQHQAWIRQGLPPIAIAINVSAAQLRGGELPQQINAAIADSGTRPDCLGIELAEPVAMKHFDNIVDILHNLKLIGLKITLDDVGSGYANLGQLSRLPVDKFKVDRSFVRYLMQDRSSMAIASAIIALGRSLDIDVIAEGIETEQELDAVRQHACHHGQGFHIGRPMPGDQFAEWYRRNALH